jgi:hypothetical protein
VYACVASSLSPWHHLECKMGLIINMLPCRIKSVNPLVKFESILLKNAQAGINNLRIIQHPPV